MSISKSIIAGLIIIVILIGAHYIGWLRPIESWTVTALGTVQRPFYVMGGGFKSLYGSWLEKKDLLVVSDELREKLKLYQVDKARLIDLEEENSRLKQELGFVSEKGYDFVAAKIITGVSDPISRSVVINRGQKDGVEKGLAVVVDGGVLIGKVIEVSNDFSKVLLLTDNTSRVAATVQSIERTSGLVEGQFGLSFSMTNIPQDQDIKENDLVVTSGLEGQIPRGLLIANIESINQIESEIFKTAVLAPIVSFDDLSYVLVVKP